MSLYRVTLFEGIENLEMFMVGYEGSVKCSPPVDSDDADVESEQGVHAVYRRVPGSTDDDIVEFDVMLKERAIVEILTRVCK